MDVISCIILLHAPKEDSVSSSTTFQPSLFDFMCINMPHRPFILYSPQSGQPWDATEQLREMSQTRKMFLRASFLCFVVSSFSLEMCIWEASDVTGLSVFPWGRGSSSFGSVEREVGSEYRLDSRGGTCNLERYCQPRMTEAEQKKHQNPQLHQHISPALFTPNDHCNLQQVWGLRLCISNQLSGQAAHAEPVVSSTIPLVWWSMCTFEHSVKFMCVYYAQCTLLAKP